MKPLPLFLAVAFFAAPLMALDTAIPSAWTKDRYQETLSKSPFALATPKVEAAPEAPKKSFTDNLYLTGLGRADGLNYVVLQQVGGESIRLWGNETGADGIKVVTVNWQDIPGKTTVKLKKGDEIGEVHFDESKQGGGGAPPPPAGANPNPSNGNGNGNANRNRGMAPPNIAGVPTPPRVNSIVPGSNPGPNGGNVAHPGMPGGSTINPARPGGTNAINVQQPQLQLQQQQQQQQNFVPPAPAGAGQATNGMPAPRQRVRTINNR